MNNVDDNIISNILIIVLGIMIVILMVLSITFLVLKMKENRKKSNKKESIESKTKEDKKNEHINGGVTYNKQSIMDFMDFDKVEDNMIIQRNGKRFLMAIECQGVNYDLMSNVEKVGVEEGFQQFLNTLKHSIQIYIQTRTINLEGSIVNYKEKLEQIEREYNKKVYEYNQMVESEVYSQEELEKKFFEITKQKNLLDYGKDIIKDTEQMSLNRSVLNKRYFIIISYYLESTENEKYDEKEIKEIAFSELYTKAQSIIRTLSACLISGNILNTKELVELLYEAYNRDEAEVFNIDRALRAEYDNLYSTSQNVFEKKIKELDKKIEENAITLANDAIDKVKSKQEQIAEEKEDNIDKLIKIMAEMLLDENKDIIGRNVVKEAKEEIKKEGVEENEKKAKTTRGRKKKATV